MRSLVITAVALVAAAALASPASAQTVTQTAHGVQTTARNGQSIVAVSCTATSQGTAQTAVRECYLRGADTKRFDAMRTGGLPGPFDAAVGAHIVVPDQSYSVCVSASVLTMNGSFYATPLSCSQVNKVA